MPTEHLRHVLHGFDARTHGPSAPGVKKILGDLDIGECPESLEVFPKKIGPDRRQIQFEKLGETDRLFLREVLWALENSPAAIFQKILLSGRLEFGNLHAPNLIDGLSELLHDVKAIKNIQCLRGFLRDDFQVGWGQRITAPSPPPSEPGGRVAPYRARAVTKPWIPPEPAVVHKRSVSREFRRKECRVPSGPLPLSCVWQSSRPTRDERGWLVLGS